MEQPEVTPRVNQLYPTLRTTNLHDQIMSKRRNACILNGVLALQGGENWFFGERSDKNLLFKYKAQIHIQYINRYTISVELKFHGGWVIRRKCLKRLLGR